MHNAYSVINETSSTYSTHGARQTVNDIVQHVNMSTEISQTRICQMCDINLFNYQRGHSHRSLAYTVQ
jgi:hypothetical protein